MQFVVHAYICTYIYSILFLFLFSVGKRVVTFFWLCVVAYLSPDAVIYLHVLFDLNAYYLLLSV